MGSLHLTMAFKASKLSYPRTGSILLNLPSYLIKEDPNPELEPDSLSLKIVEQLIKFEAAKATAIINFITVADDCSVPGSEFIDFS